MEANMSSEFSESQFVLAYPDGVDAQWWHLARNKIITDTVKSFTKSGGTILDVGCGRGIVLKHLRRQGVECFGVELASVQPLPEIVEYIHVGMDACHLPVEEKERYDTLLLLDVIEHIADPISFLQTLVSEFPNLSSVIVTVPARQELWSSFDEFYGHFRRYSLKMLPELAHALHANKIMDGYFFHLAYPVNWIATRIQVRQVQMNVPKSLFHKWIHQLIGLLMIGDYYLLPRYLPGMSIIACFEIIR